MPPAASRRATHHIRQHRGLGRALRSGAADRRAPIRRPRPARCRPARCRPGPDSLPRHRARAARHRCPGRRASPDRPPSRPNPDSLYPPNAAVGSNRLKVFAHTTPARSAEAMPRIREPFSVHTPADSPYGVLFALATASSGRAEGQHRQHRPEDLLPGDPHRLRHLGENRWREEESAVRHRARRGPAGGALGLAGVGQRRGWWPVASAELIAPTSVFLSIGSPSRSVAIRARSLSITSSATDSCTSRRDPAQQT